MKISNTMVWTCEGNGSKKKELQRKWLDEFQFGEEKEEIRG